MSSIFSSLEPSHMASSRRGMTFLDSDSESEDSHTPASNDIFDNNDQMDFSPQPPHPEYPNNQEELSIGNYFLDSEAGSDGVNDDDDDIFGPDTDADDQGNLRDFVVSDQEIEEEEEEERSGSPEWKSKNPTTPTLSSDNMQPKLKETPSSKLYDILDQRPSFEEFMKDCQGLLGRVLPVGGAPIDGVWELLFAHVPEEEQNAVSLEDMRVSKKQADEEQNTVSMPASDADIVEKMLVLRHKEDPTRQYFVAGLFAVPGRVVSVAKSRKTYTQYLYLPLYENDNRMVYLAHPSEYHSIHDHNNVPFPETAGAIFDGCVSVSDIGKKYNQKEHFSVSESEGCRTVHPNYLFDLLIASNLSDATKHPLILGQEYRPQRTTKSGKPAALIGNLSKLVDSAFVNKKSRNSSSNKPKPKKSTSTTTEDQPPLEVERPGPSKSKRGQSPPKGKRGRSPSKRNASSDETHPPSPKKQKKTSTSTLYTDTENTEFFKSPINQQEWIPFVCHMMHTLKKKKKTPSLEILKHWATEGTFKNATEQLKDPKTRTTFALMKIITTFPSEKISANDKHARKNLSQPCHHQVAEEFPLALKYLEKLKKPLYDVSELGFGEDFSSGW